MHDNMGSKKDPHMKNPMPKYILIALIIVLLVIFVAPKVFDIADDNLDDVEDRANNGD